MKKLKKGVFQLTDASLGWALLFAGLIAVVWYGSKAISKPTTASEIVTITNIISDTRMLKSDGSGYGSINFVPSLIKSDIAGVTVSGDKIYNKSGGEITVVGTGIGFTVTTSGLSQGDCIKIATTLSGGDIAATKINNGTTSSTAIPADTAAASCTSGKTNMLSFTTNS